MTKQLATLDELKPIATLLKSWNAYWTPSLTNIFYIVADFIWLNPEWDAASLYAAIKAGFVYKNGLAIVSGPRGRLLIKAPQTGCAAAALLIRR